MYYIKLILLSLDILGCHLAHFKKYIMNYFPNTLCFIFEFHVKTRMYYYHCTQFIITIIKLQA